MSKIKRIWLNNFKFFGSSSPIELAGEHLLLYGENGSGKSSLCYGLNTLLDAAVNSPEKVQKQFALPSESEDSLINIHAKMDEGAERTNAFVSVEDNNGKVYQISYRNLDPCQDTDLLESNLASDLINYQSLFRFQIPHSEQTSSLIDVFEYSVFPHLSFPTIHYHGKILRNVKTMIKEYNEGPGCTTNAKGEHIIVYKNSQEYNDFLALEAHLNANIQQLVDFINANIYDKIQNFEYDFKVHLEYTSTSHAKKDKRIERHRYNIELKLTEFEGIAVNVKYPSKFLNEARMTALAFCIRWCVLDYRLGQGEAPNALKILLLDDVMVSLDRCNRTKLIRIILDELADKFQILFFTHDRSLYSYIIRELMNRNGISKEEDLMKTDIGWQFMEMFACRKGKISEPIVQPYTSAYTKAQKYYQGDECNVDFVASGNIIRQAIEGVLKTLFIRLGITKNTDGINIDYSKTMLGDYIHIAKTHFPDLQLPLDAINALDSIKNIQLNPSSHYNPELDFYGQELEIAFNVYNTLSECDIRIVVPKGEEVIINIPTQDGAQHIYKATMNQDLVSYKIMGQPVYRIRWIPMKLTFTYSGDNPIVEHIAKKLRLDDFYLGDVEYLQNKYGILDGYIKNILTGITYKGRMLRDYLS
ncbi:hypothetical protein [Leyella stercorea]|uniref:hypothetical protein n=1 Tax=Leyella stercorea TaxID=363265 RepID=UPI0026DC870A|nr:hypothetical protein [Leyella stercorea]